MNYTVNFRNKRNTTAQDVTISMQLSEDDTKFPFEINDGNYDRTFERVQSGETVSAPYSMAIRKDSYTGYYPIKYTITFRLSSEGDLHTEEGTFYVHIVSKDKEDNLGDFDANDRTRARLIVDSYYTIPEQVYAGNEFELVLNMKNASTSVPASNILFNLESEKVSDSAVFTTKSGSSSMVVNDLGSGQSTEVRVKFTARAGVDQRSYAITIKEKYDSPEFKNAEESIVVDIPVKQYAKLSTSTIDVMPDTMTVGSESNVMFGINNTGKVILYNVTAAFEGDSIKTTDAYVGNIKPGDTGNVDIMLTGVAPTTDDGTIKIRITYEDENGVTADLRANYHAGARVHQFELHGAKASAYISLGFGGADCEARILRSAGEGSHSLSANGKTQVEELRLDGRALAKSDAYFRYYGYYDESAAFAQRALEQPAQADAARLEEDVASVRLMQMLQTSVF